MTKREIANLACKVLAVYFFVGALPGLTYVLGLVGPLIESDPWTMGDVTQQVVYASQTVIVIAAALFLWRWSGLVAAWMVGYDLQDHRDEPESSLQKATPSELHAIAFSTLGLWVLIDVVPRSFSYLAQVVYMRSFADPALHEGAQAYQAAAWIELILRLILGVWLLFGASGLLHLLGKIRRIGLEKNEHA